MNLVLEPSKELHKISSPLTLEEILDLEETLSGLTQTLYEKGGVAIAAPQAGDLRRYIVMDLGVAEATSDYITLGTKAKVNPGQNILKMMNPEIISKSGKIEILEGCLSVPDLAQKVERSSTILLKYQDEFGAFQEKEFRNFCAIVVQHEIDHLNGITLLDYCSPFKKRRYLQNN